MLDKIQAWFKKPEEWKDFNDVFSTEAEEIDLIRHLLGSINLNDLPQKEESEAERKEYCSAIAAVFPRLEKDIKEFLHAQLMFASNEAENWEQVLFARGTFNGIDLLYKNWQKANAEHLNPPPKPFNKHNPIGEIE